MKNATTDTEHNFAPSPPRWQRRKQNTPLLAVGMASALAILVPLKAETAMQTVREEVNLVDEYLDMNKDQIPDLSCVAGEDTVEWTNSKYLYCRGIGGARIWGDADNCLPVTNDIRIDTLSEQGWKAICQLDLVRDENKLSETGPVTKVLGMKTSGGGYGWIEVVINQAHNQVKAVAWAYEPDVKKPVAPPACGETFCRPTTLPPPDPPPVLDEGKISLPPTPGTNEMGFNLYCDGKFLANVPANVTHYYHNLKGGMTHHCEIKAVLPGGSESLVATVSAYIPLPEVPPLSMLFLKLEPAGSGSCTGGVTATIDGLFRTRCDSTDCQTVTDSQGRTVQNCAPNCSVAFQRDDFGKEVTLKPHADPGCEFSSWGVHSDCTDSQVLATADNKECLAYFRLREAPGNRLSSTRANPPACSDTTVLYVNQSATGAETGCSWTDAIQDLQTAVTWVREGAFSQVRQIWVAKGEYLLRSTNRDLPTTFPLINGIAVYGGFAGTETQLDQRNIFVNQTVLSGEIPPVVTAPPEINPTASMGSILIEAETCEAGLSILGNAKPTLDKVYVVFKDNYSVLCGWEDSKLILPDPQK